MPLQAAFLESGVVNQLAILLQSLVHNSNDTLEVTALCTMALEVVTVLFNPDVCLNPMSPAPQRVQDECPSLNEVKSTYESSSSHTLQEVSRTAHLVTRDSLNQLPFPPSDRLARASMEPRVSSDSVFRGLCAYHSSALDACKRHSACSVVFPVQQSYWFPFGCRQVH